jgi:hypothetical protein
MATGTPQVAAAGSRRCQAVDGADRRGYGGAGSAPMELWEY